MGKFAWGVARTPFFSSYPKIDYFKVCQST